MGQAGLLLTAAVLCALTWRKWGYLPIDSGREMYVPAAIAQGKRLYFDLWNPYGPLIPYWHAALFRAFGLHLGVLLGAGIGVIIITALLLFSVSREFLPASLSFAAAFAFLLQAFQADLFNWVLPYSYAAAYGSMFAVLLLWLLLRGEKSERSLWTLVAAGFVASLMALAKPEFGAAGYAGLICFAAMRAFGTCRAAFRKTVAAFLPGALLCAAVYGWYLHALGAELFLGRNLALLPGSYFQQHFAAMWNQRTGLVLSPGALTLSIGRGLAGLALLTAAVVLAAKVRPARWILAAAALCLCLTAAGPATAWAPHEAVKILRLLFFNNGMVWCGLALLAAALLRPTEAWAPRVALLIVIAMVSGLRVLTKIAPEGYSIYYDTLVYVMWLAAVAELAGLFGPKLDGAFAVVTSLVLCASVVALTLDRYPVRQRSYAVSSARGTLYTTPEIGKGFQEAIRFAKAAKRDSARIAILPEDTALYFFSGTLAPSRWYIVTPQILAPGKDTADYIAELDRAHLRYILVSDRATPEFGYPVFGVDYGQQIAAWIREHYRMIGQLGDYEPVADPSTWGALVYERK